MFNQLLDLSVALERMSLSLTEDTGGVFHSHNHAEISCDKLTQEQTILLDKTHAVFLVNPTIFLQSLKETERSFNMHLQVNC